MYKPYFDKRKEIMNSTKITAEDVVGNIISQNSESPEQTTKLNNFSAKNI